MIGSKTGDLADRLHRGRNDDGGWGYYPGKASRIEPTCWAALYFSRSETSKPDLADGAARWLASRQRIDGFLDDLTGGPPNLGFNGLAALIVPGAGPWSGEPAKDLLAALART